MGPRLSEMVYVRRMRIAVVLVLVLLALCSDAEADLLRNPVDGKTYAVAPDQVDRWLAVGWVPVSTEERAARVSQQADEARRETENEQDAAERNRWLLAIGLSILGMLLLALAQRATVRWMSRK